MVRRRAELKRIEKRLNRHVSFSKRRAGILEKAQELSVLCDADVGLIIFSPNGKLYEFSTSNCMDKIISRYKQFSDAERSVNKGQHDLVRPLILSAESGTSIEVPRFLPRLIEGSESPKLTLDELTQLKRELEIALEMTMTRKTIMMMAMRKELQQKENFLQENNLLCCKNEDQNENGVSVVANWEGAQNGGCLEGSEERNYTHILTTKI